MVETLLGIQIVSIFFGLFMMYLIRLHYRRGNIGQKEYLLWLSCWIFFLVFALFPGVLTPVITTLKIVRVLDLLMVIAFMIITYITFTDHMAIRDLYRQINRLVSEKAVSKAVRSTRDLKVKDSPEK